MFSYFLKSLLFAAFLSMELVAQISVSPQKKKTGPKVKKQMPPTVWFTAEMNKDSSITPVFRPDGTASVYYAYYTFYADSTFTYYAFEGLNESSEIFGSWSLNEKEKTFSLLFRKKEQSRYGIPDRQSPILINKRYDYKVLRFNDSVALFKPLSGDNPDQLGVWAIKKANPPKLLDNGKTLETQRTVLKSLVNCEWWIAALDDDWQVLRYGSGSAHFSTISFSENGTYKAAYYDRYEGKTNHVNGKWNFDPNTNLVVINAGAEHQDHYMITQLDSRALVLGGVKMPGDDFVPKLRVYLKPAQATNGTKAE